MGIAIELLDQTIKIAKKTGVKCIQIYTNKMSVDNSVKLIDYKKYPIAFNLKTAKAGLSH